MGGEDICRAGDVCAGTSRIRKMQAWMAEIRVDTPGHKEDADLRVGILETKKAMGPDLCCHSKLLISISLTRCVTYW